MLLKIFSLVYFLIDFQYVFGYNCMPDDKDFAKGCQTLVTTGYKYEHFYPIEKQFNGDVFLRLYVKAETDAHILFSYNNPQGSENLGRHYEIIIGAYGNFRSAIRTRKQGDNIDPHEEHNILSSAKWREFWIRISRDGLIEVGKGTSRTTFLSWKDPNTFEINYYSLSCWAPDGTTDFKSHHTAYWIHQCSNENYNKYNAEKFKCDLLSNYDQRTPSVEAIHSVVQININSFYADWDISNGIFKLIGTAKMTWQDNRLAWEPTEFYGLYSLNITNHPIWRPDLRVANAVFDNDNPFGTGETIVSHDGIVSWTTPINLQTKCSDTGAKSEASDLHTCRINISTNTLGSEIHISDAESPKISSPCIINEARAVNLRKIDSKSTSHSLSIDVPFKIRNGYNSTSSNSKCVVFSVPLLTMIIISVLEKQYWVTYS